MKINKKIMKRLLLGFFPVILTILFAGFFYLTLPVFYYLTMFEQIGLLISFYILLIGICGFVYLWLYGQSLKDVLTEGEHLRNGSRAFVVSVILIGIFVIGLFYDSNVNNRGFDLLENIFGLFRIWIFFYLISFVAIEFWTSYQKRKKMKDK